MKLTPEEQAICDKYRAFDATGHVHCHECPLHFGNPDLWDFRCKANSVYDPVTNDYVEEDFKEEDYCNA